MRIGEAASRSGVANHVLRHWEDMRVVVPQRSAAGHRDYSDEQVERLRIVRACQEVGLSLSEIRHVLNRGEEAREAVIDRRLSALRRQRADLDAAEAFLSHVRSCRHSLVTRCPDCARYASDWGPRSDLDPPAQCVARG